MIEFDKNNLAIYKDDNLNIFKRINDNSIDVILTDPPYLYLKNQKLERPFDEQLFFQECKRVLTHNGFIVLFGRGTSFYRWNTILGNLDFTFKEEIIWNKSHCTSPLMRLSRVHETISIHTKGKGVINKVKIPYLEMKSHDLESVIGDVKRIRSILKNTKSLDAVLEFLENNVVERDEYGKAGVTHDGIHKPNRCVSVMQSVEFGLNEKSIIKEVRNHYGAIHPTEKPVRLMERLLNITVKDKDAVVFDPFAGSCPVAVACHNLLLNFIGCEIDKEYFNNSVERLKVECSQQKINY